MKIYTKKGDTGTTQLIGGTHVPKHHLRIEAYGTMDELNSWIGYVCGLIERKHHQDVLREIQDRLFTIGSLLASDPDKAKMNLPDILESDVLLLEKEIDIMQDALPELKSFLLPGGNQANAACHITRCVCRRAERLTVQLNETQKVAPLVLQYLNRLSDYLFVLARKISAEAGAEEIPWKPRM